MEAYQVKYRMQAAARRAGCTDDHTNNFLRHAGLWADDVVGLSAVAIDRLVALYVMYAANAASVPVPMTAARALEIARNVND